MGKAKRTEQKTEKIISKASRTGFEFSIAGRKAVLYSLSNSRVNAIRKAMEHYLRAEGHTLALPQRSAVVAVPAANERVYLIQPHYAPPLDFGKPPIRDIAETIMRRGGVNVMRREAVARLFDWITGYLYYENRLYCLLTGAEAGGDPRGFVILNAARKNRNPKIDVLIRPKPAGQRGSSQEMR